MGLHLERPLGGNGGPLRRLLALHLRGGGLAFGCRGLALRVGDPLVDPLRVGPGAGAVARERDVRVSLGQGRLEPLDGGRELLALGLRGAELEVELLELRDGRRGGEGHLQLAQSLLGFARRALGPVGSSQDVVILRAATVPVPAFGLFVLEVRRSPAQPPDVHRADADEEQEHNELQRTPDAGRLVVDRRVALVDLDDTVDRAVVRQRDGDEGLEQLLIGSLETVVVRAGARGRSPSGRPTPARSTDRRRR